MSNATASSPATSIHSITRLSAFEKEKNPLICFMFRVEILE